LKKDVSDKGGRRVRARIYREFVQLAALSALLAACPRLKAQTTTPTLTPTPKADSASAGNAEHGKKLFVADGCYQCHGYAAQGGVGPKLGPDPLPYSFVSHYVRHPAGTMPPYTEKVASDQDLADIYAFLKSLPEPPKAKDLPLLNQ
jgi:mono/diheme cytochrome c family protein